MENESDQRSDDLASKMYDTLDEKIYRDTGSNANSPKEYSESEWYTSK